MTSDPSHLPDDARPQPADRDELAGSVEAAPAPADPQPQDEQAASDPAAVAEPDSEVSQPASAAPPESAAAPESASPPESASLPESAAPPESAPPPSEPPRKQTPPGGPLANALERLKAQAAVRPLTEAQRGRQPSRSIPPKPEEGRPEAAKADPERAPARRPETPRPEGGRPRGKRPGEPRSDRPDRRAGQREESAAPPAAPGTRVPPPSRRDRLSPELEMELEAAFSQATMDDLVSGTAPQGAAEQLENDSRLWASVVKIHGDNVFFSLGGPNEGVASLRQFQEPPAIGAQVEVVVRGYLAEDGLYEVTVPGGSIDVHDWSDLVEGAVVEARVTGSNVGGLECMVGAIRGFIPASQVAMHRVEQFSDYYDKKLQCVVTEANERRRNLVLSHRAVLEREKEESRQKLLEELEVGQVREGLVTSIRDFGAFVDLGGIEGLVHISQLSWDRVNHPSEVLQSGQKVRVKVEKINPETGKIGLSYRDLLEHPWDKAEEQFPVDSTVKGMVTRIAKFGAFVKIAPGIEGLIHVSELAHHRVVQVSSVVKEGEEVEVKVLSVDKENQRIGLSLKAAHPLPGDEAAAEPEEDEPRPQPTVKPRQGPLRGGKDTSSGGERFGLKW